MRKTGLFLIVLSFLVLGACGRTAESANNASAQKTAGTIRIVRQNGITYAPIYIMEKKKLLEKYLPDITVEYRVISGTSAIVEALVTNKVDITPIGPLSLFTANSKGADFKAISGITGSTVLELVVNNPQINTIRDFTPHDKIAVPSLNTTQQMFLSRASEKELGNPHALDANIQIMPHPDAATALINNRGITAHVSSLPYLDVELQAGLKSILTSRQVYGESEFNSSVIVATKKLHDEQPLVLAAFMAALSESICLIRQRDPEALAVIAETEKTSIEKARVYLDWEGLNFTTAILGTDVYAEYLLENGIISKAPALEEILWEPALAAIGKRSGGPGVLEKAQK